MSNPKVIGETDLQKLLAAMQAEIVPGEFVFATLSPAKRKSLEIETVCEFREAEGVAVIVSRPQAEELGLEYIYPCRQITLTVHSSLEAVGFLAAISAKLAAAGISTNAESAYFHDHLFVPVDRAEEALEILRNLAAAAAV